MQAKSSELLNARNEQDLINNALREDLQRLGDEFEEAKDKLRYQTSCAAEVQMQYDHSQRHQAILVRTNEELWTKVKELEMLHKHAEEDKLRGDQDRSRLATEVKVLKDTVTRTEIEHSELMQEMSLYVTNMTAASAKVRELSDAKQLAERSSAQLEERLGESASREVALRQSLSQAEAMLLDLSTAQQKLDEQAGSIRELTRSSALWQASAKELELSNAELAKRKDDLTTQTMHQDDELQKFRSKLVTLSSAVSKWEATASSLTDQLGALTLRQQEMTSELQSERGSCLGVRRELEAETQRRVDTQVALERLGAQFNSERESSAKRVAALESERDDQAISIRLLETQRDSLVLAVTEANEQLRITSNERDSATEAAHALRLQEYENRWVLYMYCSCARARMPIADRSYC